MIGRWLATLLAVVFALAVITGAPLSAARKSTFDHFSTGFPLTGAHVVVACETCHKAAVFKGTPKNCSGCHNDVRTNGKPANHIVTQAECDSCHTTRQWTINRFDHTGATQSCATCHNGIRATGKTANHPQPIEQSMPRLP